MADDEDAGYAFVEHTADIGFRAWGPTVGDAFAETARALFAYMVDVDAVRAAAEESFTLEAASLDRLLFRFLDELLFRHQTTVKVYGAFDVDVTRHGDAWRLTASVGGEALDEARHGHVHEVKAVTYHDMRVDPGPPARVLVLVDI